MLAARRLAVVLLAALLPLSGCATEGTASALDAPGTSAPAAPPTVVPASPPPSAEVVDVVTVVVVGDSITAGTGDGDRAEHPGPQSWLHGASGPPLEFSGGWAVPGATTAQMRDGAAGLTAEVLVLLGGTNDLATGVEWAASREHLLGVVAAVDEGAVVLSAIPPSDTMPARAVEYNARLVELAREQGWVFVDPWTGISQDGAFAPGTSPDGIHPTPEAATQAGAVIRAAVLG